MADWIKGNRFLSHSEMENNALIVYGELANRGWTINAICGTLGNMQAESSINPAIWENLVPNINRGWGLVQWTPSTNFTNWARQNGYANDDGYAQLKWIDEVTTQVGQWIPTSQYNFSFAEYKVATNAVEYLADAFLKNFERPYDPDQPIRGQYAREWLAFLTDKPIPPPTPDPPHFGQMPIWLALKPIIRR